MYPKGNLFIKASHGKLEAILKEPKGETKGIGLVCHPHPLGGGTMHNKVVFRAASGLIDAGLITLRFNFSGVGNSTGEHDDGNGEKQDVIDAIAYLIENYPGQPITLAGFSFGSRVGTEIGMDHESVVRLISIGTPVDKYTDYGFLENLRKPIFFVHGDQDEFGSVENLSELISKVSAVTDTSYKIFENCGHFFEGHLTQLREAINDWVLEKTAEVD
ncbi:MAG: alpha/beta hydrolase [Pyrinomonadaceae bacterium]|nr:alpha/beta hydrolase [Pyrinomonadaceae bacterium]